MNLTQRINDYLRSGGLFNPEMMEHDKVRDLLLDCRDRISILGALLDQVPHAIQYLPGCTTDCPRCQWEKMKAEK